jgi:hypothetical protein
MGGFLKVPSPSKPSSAPVVPASAAVDPEQTERQRRLDALARQRAGRAGTIATSSRGVLIPTDWLPQRKSLLGE